MAKQNFFMHSNVVLTPIFKYSTTELAVIPYASIHMAVVYLVNGVNLRFPFASYLN